MSCLLCGALFVMYLCCLASSVNCAWVVVLLLVVCRTLYCCFLINAYCVLCIAFCVMCLVYRLVFIVSCFVFVVYCGLCVVCDVLFILYRVLFSV